MDKKNSYNWKEENNNIFLIYRKFNGEKICALINEFKNAKDR